MVTYQQHDSGKCSFTIQPNCAFGWTRMKYLFLFFLACTAAVAGYFALQGAWLVLPFAGLEMLVLGLGVYLSSRDSATREILCIDEDELVVLRGRRRLLELARLPRYWTRVSLLRDTTSWYPSRLVLACHGHRVEIGAALVEQERDQLAHDLRERMSFYPDWRHPRPSPLPEGLDAAEQKA